MRVLFTTRMPKVDCKMSYVTKVLQPNESVKVYGKLHWVMYLRAWLFGIAAIPASYLHPLAGLLLAALAIAQLVNAWFTQWTTELAVTDRRVLVKRGFISRTTGEMNMDKVESVEVKQSVLGRLLDYGTVRIHGTGEGL